MSGGQALYRESNTGNQSRIRNALLQIRLVVVAENRSSTSNGVEVHSTASWSECMPGYVCIGSCFAHQAGLGQLVGHELSIVVINDVIVSKTSREACTSVIIVSS